MARIAIPVDTTELCSYGCGQQAKFMNGSKRLMCCKSSNSCSAIRAKNSKGLSKAHETGNYLYEFGGKRGWSKGKTKETDERIERISNLNRGKRRITDEEKLQKVIYREQCQFNLAGIIQHVKGFVLLKQFGMYDRLRNTEGVVRDHRISVQYGFDNQIDPKIISHPANCEFLTHKKNAGKTHQSSLTLDELLVEIETFNALVAQLV